MRKEHRIVVDPIDGHRRLDPVPDGGDLARYYQSRYYDLVRQGGRAPELQRLGTHGPGRENELRWLRHTLYADVVDMARELAPGSRLLEVGAGTGDFVSFAIEQGLSVDGIEPAADAVRLARTRGVDLFEGDLAAFLQAYPGKAYDAVVLLNVMEHVPDAVEVLAGATQAAVEGGIVLIRVPNDFTKIQEAARQFLDRDAWWIAVPDHVHYFNVESLERFARNNGLEPLLVQSDFPMELFLLAGSDYTRDRETGASCHARRVAFELATDPSLRRSLYREFARAGLGRNVTLAARKRGPRVNMATFVRENDGYTYVGFRSADAEALRRFRNAQLDVLRQKELLSATAQEVWVRDVVEPTHASQLPGFLLVSILDSEQTFIGYGGLTNIDWADARAEISFLTEPGRAGNEEIYSRDFEAFLRFLQTWAFNELGLNRLFAETYAFRTAHIVSLERAGLRCEGRLRQHITNRREGSGFSDSLVHAVLAEEWQGRR